MLVNLSLVLDEKNEIRLDILRNKSLEEVDNYTTKFNNSEEIREDNKEKISDYLKLNQKYTSTFKRESNKKGSIVITYQERDRYVKMRVLYKENTAKLDDKKVVRGIIENLRNNCDCDGIKSFIESHRHDFFGTQSDYYNLKDISRLSRIARETEDKRKERYIKYVKGRLLEYIEFHKSPDIHRLIRKLDSEIEKKYGFTTKRIVKTNKGTLKVHQVIEDPKELKKSIEFNGCSIYQEKDGQYSLFEETAKLNIKEIKKSKKIPIEDDDEPIIDDYGFEEEGKIHKG